VADFASKYDAVINFNINYRQIIAQAPASPGRNYGHPDQSLSHYTTLPVTKTLVTFHGGALSALRFYLIPAPGRFPAQ
jgi:hypothetical protein